MPAALDEEDDKPLSPEALVLQRRAIRLAALSGVLLLLGLLAVLGAIVYKIISAPNSQRTTVAAEILVPEGTRVVSLAPADDALLLLIETDGGQRILTVDRASGRVLGRTIIRAK